MGEGGGGGGGQAAGVLKSMACAFLYGLVAY